jgi:hypothetical protein
MGETLRGDVKSTASTATDKLATLAIYRGSSGRLGTRNVDRRRFPCPSISANSRSP